MKSPLSNCEVIVLQLAKAPTRKPKTNPHYRGHRVSQRQNTEEKQYKNYTIKNIARRVAGVP
jgi:hypothetical protein